jgi:hypothetical protein
MYTPLTQECPDRNRAKHCAYCDTSSHNTMDCTIVWRKYDYDSPPGDTHDLEANCYECGASGHFGDDCKDVQRKVGWRTTAFYSRDASSSSTPPLKPDTRPKSRVSTGSRGYADSPSYSTGYNDYQNGGYTYPASGGYRDYVAGYAGNINENGRYAVTPRRQSEARHQSGTKLLKITSRDTGTFN